MAHYGIQMNAQDQCHLPILGDYSHAFSFHCHNEKEKNNTKIWKCAFQPSLDNPEGTTNILATCGSKVVCFIDVVTQKLVERFQDMDKDENFCTLAWTTIEVGKKKINILAVAGESGAVKLIYHEKLLMYAIIREHKKCINCLLFHPTYARLLFSGSKDGFVILWDIGIPDEVPSTEYLPLLKISLQGTCGNALNLVFSENSQLLIAGAERGCVGWAVTDCSSLSPGKRAKVIERPDIIFQHPKSNSLTVDGLLSLPGDLSATKQVGSGEVLIWNLSKHVEKQTKEVTIEPLIKLKYPHHGVKYLNLGYNNGLLGVGDDQGNLLLYNIKEVVTQRRSDDEENMLQPSNVLEWRIISNKIAPLLVRQGVVVNTVTIGSNVKYVVGGTDNNLVCVWKRNNQEEQKEQAS